MQTDKKTNYCRKQRQMPLGWLQTLQHKLLLGLENHISSCPRCQSRLMGVQRAETALKMLLTQPMTPGLLQKANQNALHVLKKDLRSAPCAQKLRTAETRPDWTGRHRKVLESAFGAAACLAVLVLLKTGIFSKMREIENDGRAVMHNYYSKHLDADLMSELFEPPSKEV